MRRQWLPIALIFYQKAFVVELFFGDFYGEGDVFGIG